MEAYGGMAVPEKQLPYTPWATASLRAEINKKTLGPAGNRTPLTTLNELPQTFRDSEARGSNGTSSQKA